MVLKIAKLLVYLKNASKINLITTTVNFNKSNIFILTLLYKEGLIQSFTVTLNKKQIVVILRYSYNKNPFKTLKTFTQVAFTFTLTYREICKLSTKKFVSIFSTDKGLRTGLNCKQQRLGGRLYLIC